MIGRADIKKSKSDIAMNAWPPQANYPCSNFSDSSCLKLVISKGLIGPAFAVRNRTENQDQASFCPFVLREAHISPEPRKGSQSERYANRASETQPNERGPQSQSLSRSYGSNLPTSLTYIVLVTKGCSPWRPDADISTAQHENHGLSLGFARARKGVPGTTHETRCSFEAACPYLGMTPFQGLRTSYEEKKQSLPWCLRVRLR
ncbi:uncharacterized protein NPIL_425731 [Nephila pilipes]|uniref:Uncharacterized protein n=1 Tax=Nephila pilipes TaxID=299642 RepID=A0A8X6Q5M3_NEPPI|nr:uncharacterized protein NPIL_425731 [Nephila pilipes]